MRLVPWGSTNKPGSAFFGCLFGGTGKILSDRSVATKYKTASKLTIVTELKLEDGMGPVRQAAAGRCGWSRRFGHRCFLAFLALDAEVVS